MSNKTLVGARGLNSIADPSSFRGTSGRGTKGAKEEVVVEPEPAPKVVETPVVETVEEPSSPEVKLSLSASRKPAKKKPAIEKPTTPERKRRELSVPLPIYDMVNETKQNPTDLVLRAVRNYGEEIEAGDFARGVHRGRKRLRLSVTDEEFNTISKIGSARGWNRSETVAVLLEAELTQSSKTDELENSAFPI